MTLQFTRWGLAGGGSPSDTSFMGLLEDADAADAEWQAGPGKIAMRRQVQRISFQAYLREVAAEFIPLAIARQIAPLPASHYIPEPYWEITVVVPGKSSDGGDRRQSFHVLTDGSVHIFEDAWHWLSSSSPAGLEFSEEDKDNIRKGFARALTGRYWS